MDLMGRFSKQSSKGNQYILVGYHYNVNNIMVALIKNQKGKTIAETQSAIHNTLKKAGVPSKLHILDNETS